MSVRREMLWAGLLVIAPLVLQPAVCLAQRPAGGVSLEEIWDAWRERQGEVQSLQVRGSTRLVISARHFAQTLIETQPGRPPTKGRRDQVREYSWSLLVAGERVRYEDVSLSYAGDDEALMVPATYAFDGEAERLLIQSTELPGTGRSDRGMLDDGDLQDVWNMLWLRPLALAVSPLHPKVMGPRPQGWRIDSMPAVVDGHRCLVLKNRPKDAPTELKYTDLVYVDPQSDFVPRRLATIRRGTVRVQVDIRYEGDQPKPWFPSEWTYSLFFADGALQQSQQLRVRQAALNVPVEDEQFHLKFPPGTRVHDRRGIDRTKGEQGPMLLVQADGSMVPYRPELEREGSWWRTALFAVVALAGISALIIFLRRRYT